MANIIYYIQRLSFKIVNFIFGKTTIFIVIFGWYLVITGLLSLVSPEKARQRLITSGFGIVKFNILIACFFLWGVVVKMTQALSGAVQTIVFLGGLLALLFLFFWARASAKRKLAAVAAGLSVKFLTVFSWCQVIIGGLMVYFQRRLW